MSRHHQKTNATSIPKLLYQLIQNKTESLITLYTQEGHIHTGNLVACDNPNTEHSKDSLVHFNIIEIDHQQPHALYLKTESISAVEIHTPDNFIQQIVDSSAIPLSQKALKSWLKQHQQELAIPQVELDAQWNDIETDQQRQNIKLLALDLQEALSILAGSDVMGHQPLANIKQICFLQHQSTLKENPLKVERDHQQISIYADFKQKNLSNSVEQLRQRFDLLI